jgi:hypothetical protein
MAKEAVSFLAPCLPYLLGKGGQAEEAAKKLGADVWESAKALWAKVWPKVESRPAAKEAAEDTATDPADEGALASLLHQLKKILTEDPALAADVGRWKAAAERAGVSVTARGKGNVAVGRDVKGSTIITGSQNVVGGPPAKRPDGE